MIPNEKAIIVDEDDNVIEYRHRKDVGNFDRHRIVSIWVTDSSGKVLIAKRAKTMHIQPNRWGPAAAGTVSHNEEYSETAVRELAEEIGLSGVSLTMVGKFRVDEDRGERRMCAVFVGKTDIDITKLTLQEEEVAAVKLIELDELKADLAAHPEHYVVNMDLVIESIERYTQH